MSKDSNKNYTIFLTLSIFVCFIVVIIVGGIFFNQSEQLDIQKELLKQITLETQAKSSQIVDLQLKDNRAMLSTIIYNSGFDINNPEYFIFDYFLINFGNSKAENITVVCKMLDTYGRSAFETRDNYKIQDANSYELKEMTPNIPSTFDMTKDYSPLCYVESCDGNCETLYKRIPKMEEAYEK